MRSKILSSWYLRKSYFTQLLARAHKHKISDSVKIWAYYRLGMYNYVLSVDDTSLTWKAEFSKIVSCAALGKMDEVQHRLEIFLQTTRTKRQRLMLIKALTAYLPQWALAHAEELGAPPDLHIALLYTTGREKEALERTKKYMVQKKYREAPELLLLYSNLNRTQSPSEKLHNLNIYLAQFGLSKLRLIHPKEPVCVKNLKGTVAEYTDNKALVSVIMTTFNTEEYVTAALTSVLSQSYKNLEVIVVDDNSSDKTVALVKKVMKIDHRVKCIQLQRNVGTYVAKNIGIEKAKGLFITCHDSDDYSHPLKIESQVKPLLDNKKLVASISNWVRLDSEGNYYTRYVYPYMRMNLSSLMFRKKEVLRKVGMYDTVKTGADSEFYARIGLAFGKKRIHRINKPLSFGAHRENSLMTAKDTGYNSSSVSYNRLAYWEAWNLWHIHEATYKRVPFMAFDEKSVRKFEAPKELMVKREDIAFVKALLK